MKLAAMEGVYNGKNGQELIAFGILNPDQEIRQRRERISFRHTHTQTVIHLGDPGNRRIRSRNQRYY